MNRLKRTALRLITIVSLALLIGCAGFRSSRTDVIKKPPYYKRMGQIQSAWKIAHFPVIMDRRVDNPTDHAWSVLINHINDLLKNKAWTEPANHPPLAAEEGPDIFYGYSDMFGAPGSVSHDFEEDEEEKRPPMILYTQFPTDAWKTAMAASLDPHIDGVLVLMVGLTEYLPRQKNVWGSKEFALGTGYRIPVKWLTSLDDPVEVLQVTGALLNREGKVVHAGAEGILAARPASFFESIIGLQNALSGESIGKITSEIRRDDLTGRPLALDVAVQNLVANLLYRKHLIIE